ncbi:MAG: helix-turn-helix transcriptional regulator [Acidobacteriota bacterium]
MDFKRQQLTELGKKLRELREQSGLSQAELGRRSEISTVLVRRIEAGQVEPSILVVLRMGQALAEKLPAEAVPKTRRSSRGQEASANILVWLVSHVESWGHMVNSRWRRMLKNPLLRKTAGADPFGVSFDQKVRLLQLFGELPSLRSRRGRPARQR